MRQSDQAHSVGKAPAAVPEAVGHTPDSRTSKRCPQAGDAMVAPSSLLVPLRFAVVDEALSAAPEFLATQSDLLFLSTEFNLIRRELDAWRVLAEQEAPATSAYVEVMGRHVSRLLEALMLRELGDGENLWRTVELTQDGMIIRNDHMLMRGSLLDLRFLLPGAGIGIRTLGRVVRCDQPSRDGCHLIGVQFLDLGEADRELLSRYLGTITS